MQTLNVSSNPHMRSNFSTSTIMLDVIIALIPASIVGIYNFGIRALFIIATCIIACVLSELIFEKIMKQKNTIGDLSAVVTGLILALNLSVNVPIWQCVAGSIFAMIIVKALFGGLGQNFINPALAARAFMVLAFAGPMTNFVTDTFTGATPLTLVKNAGLESVSGALADGGYTLSDMFFGTCAGTIGETSVVALLIGAVYLLIRKVISFKIPVIYIVTVVIFMAIYSLAARGGLDMEFLAAQICGGGLIFGAFFCATDYVTTPITPKGTIIFAILLGVLTSVFRIFGNSAEGVSFSILIGNLLVPLIEKISVPKFFGEGASKQ